MTTDTLLTEAADALERAARIRIVVGGETALEMPQAERERFFAMARQLREREAKAEGLDDIHSCSYYCERPGCVRAQRDELRARLTSEDAGPASDPNVSTKYYELLFAVARKYPGESRHDTALKYIRRAEETTSVICSVGAALATKPGDGESRG